MHNYFYILMALLLALLYWLLEGLVHHYLFVEPWEFIPTDANELWMRSTVALLILLFGIYANFHSRRTLAQEEEKLSLLKTTVGASNHILNNYLQQMQLFRMEAEKCPNFDGAIIELYDRVMEQTVDEIRKLTTLTESGDVNDEAIRQAIFPNKHNIQ